ncbi:MAG: recombinase family protein [Lachnospiraceae bacterium]|nr:recombinase family protein [Lachnospiraceae bacterium]
MAAIQKITLMPPVKTLKKRVAAYARVSVDTEELMHSLSAQVSYYSALIQKNPEWEFAGIYADEGITGTSTARRKEFNRMVADCDAGKIDIVLVKSISRFARNTVDLLNTVRHLKDINVEVRFERESISSLTADGELMMTLLAAFAQEESISIAENVTWTIRKKMEAGIPNGHKDVFGYEWDGEIYRIVPEQGALVQEMFSKYNAGASAYSIAKEMAERGVRGINGALMSDGGVKDILRNISYTGSMLLQKNYTKNHKRKKNKGELPQYLVEEMFEPLIDSSTFSKAQEILQKRADESPNKDAQLTMFSGMMRCGLCGKSISRRHRKTEIIWRCNTAERKGIAVCNMRTLPETELISAAKAVLGVDTLDAQEFKKAVRLITVFTDRIDFNLNNGKVKSVVRSYGSKRRGIFSGKIRCGNCGEIFLRDVWRWNKDGEQITAHLWHCKSRRSECPSKRIYECELSDALEEIMGIDYERRFSTEVDSVIVYDDRLEIIFYDKKVETWQRE